jgi:hypothetical protein
MESKKNADQKPCTYIISLKPLHVITTHSDDEASLSDNTSTLVIEHTPKSTYHFAPDTIDTVSITTTTNLDSSSKYPINPDNSESDFTSHPTSTPTAPPHSLCSPTTRGDNGSIKEALAIPRLQLLSLQAFMTRNIPPDTIITHYHNQQISSHSLHTTAPATWLNDEVINFYLAYLTHQDHLDKDGTSRHRHHFFNSFFVTKLLDEGQSNQYAYRNVMRWSRKVYSSDLFQLHKIFFPCNIS